MKPAPILNLQHPLPEKSATEHFQTLLERPGVRLERIVSDGQTNEPPARPSGSAPPPEGASKVLGRPGDSPDSPPGFWYEQIEDEWVLLLAGSAALEYGDGTRVELGVGDSLLIPAGLRHRVARTAPRTVWLALFCAPADPG